jgi:hypothetical protein
MSERLGGVGLIITGNVVLDALRRDGRNILRRRRDSSEHCRTGET